MLTAGVDNLTGTGGNDTFDGRQIQGGVNPVQTFDQFDTVNGGAGTGDRIIVSNTVADIDFTNTREIEILATAGNVTVGSLAQAAGINTVNLLGTTGTADVRTFAGDLTVTGGAGANTVQVNQNTAGAKDLSGLGVGAIDTVTMTTTTGAAAGSQAFNFVSADAGNGTVSNIVVGTTTIADENVKVTASIANVFSVNGVDAAGALVAGQARGNFSVVELGSSGNDDTQTTVNAGQPTVGGNVYINGGGGNDTITGSATTGERHFLVGGAGNDTLNLQTVAGGEIVVIAGGGDDIVRFTNANGVQTANLGKVNVSLSAGDNFVNFGSTNLKLNQALVGTTNPNDILTGGTGMDTLAANSVILTNGANIVPSNTSTNVSISGFEALQVQDALAADLTTLNIQSGIDTVTLAAGTDATGHTVAFEAGSKTVNIGSGTNAARGESAGGQLGAALAVSAAGTATTDALVINNTNVPVAGVAAAAANNAFNGQAITATGFESVTLNTGATATIAQTTGQITVRGQNETPATAALSNQDALSLTLTGANGLTTGAISANTNGTLTIDASGMTAQASGTTLSLGAATVNSASTAGGVAAGQVVVTGSGGNDVIAMGTQKYTIDAGAGNDTVNAITNALKTNDVVNGGDGVDELQIGASIAAAAAAGVSNFETLAVRAGAVSQDMIQFVNNTGFDTLKVLDTGTVDLTNVGAGLNTINIDGVAATAVSFDRLLDNATNAVTVTTKAVATGAGADVGSTITTLTVNDEETVNINTGASVLTNGMTYVSNLTVTTLNATDATNINVTGAGDVSVTAGASGALTGFGTTARTITVDASQATGNVTFDGATATATQVLNITGPNTTSGTNNLTGGAAADVITAGSGNDVITGGSGVDTINISAGGADVIALNGILSGANRDIVTGFQVGTATGADKVRLGIDDTSVGTNAGDPIVIQDQATAPTAALTFNTDNSDLLELSFDLFGNGTALDLDLYTDGTGLLGALGQPLSVAADTHKGYIVAYQGDNAYLFHAADSADADATLQASEIQLVGVFNGVAVSGFEADNFTLVA